MDVSSDDSFVWTNASHVSSSSDSDSMSDTKGLNGHIEMTPKKKHSKAMEETKMETNKAKKRKKNQSMETDMEDFQSSKKKKVKTEILSDQSSQMESNHRIGFENTGDENYLGIKIKTEELSTSETSYSKPKKKKHKKHNDSEILNESKNVDDTYLNLCAKQEVMTDTELNNTTKVKKVKKNMKNENTLLTNGYHEVDEQYLNVKVKEEPSDSTVKSKKKKKSKQSISSNLDIEQNVDENFLDIKVKEEENSFTKKSKKKKHSIGSNDNLPSSDVDNSMNNKQTPDEVTSYPVTNSPKNRKNRKSLNSSTEVDLETMKNPKKSKKDKHNQEERESFINIHEDSLSNHVSKSNETSINESKKSEKQQTPVKQKKNNHSTSSYSDEDKHVGNKEHIFKKPQVSNKLSDNRYNSSNINEKNPDLNESTSLGNKSEIKNSGRLSDRKMSYDSSDEDSPAENTKMSATDMSISPILNQTISNRKHSLRGDSSDDDNKVTDTFTEPIPKNQSSKNILKRTVSRGDSSDQDKEKSPAPVPKSPKVKKQSRKNTSTRTVSRGDSSDEDKEKSPAPVPKSPQVKKQLSKDVTRRTIGKDGSSGSSSEEDKEKSPEPISKPQAKKHSKCTSGEESSSDERGKSPTSVTKSPSKKFASNNISRRTISDSSEDSAVENNNKSVVKSPSKKSTNNVSKRITSDSSQEDSPDEDRNKSVIKSPKKQPSNNISKRTVSKSDDTSDEDNSNKKPAAQPKTVIKRKITDRILFEPDDSDADISTSRLKHFLETNSNLHPITQKATSNTVITDDDEIWILKCPRDINVKTLKDSEFHLDKKCKFKMNGKTYLGTVDNDIEKVAVTSFEHNRFLIKNVPVNGVVHIKKRVPKQHLRDDSMLMLNQNHFIPLPETKCRHPLFGSSFKKAIIVPKHIEQRLKDSEKVKVSEDLSPEEERRQRKKLQKRLRRSLMEEPMEDAPKQEVVPEVKKKAKKRKHEDEDEPPKKKKKKRHNESSEVWDSAQAIEESLFNY